MAIIAPTQKMVAPRGESVMTITWTGLTLRTGTCTCPGASPVLNWLTGTHGLVAANIGSIHWLVPTGGTAGMYQLTAVGSTTTATFSLVSGNATLVTAVACTLGDIGAPFSQSDASLDRMLQVHGTFGASGNLALNGSIDGINYAVLADNAGTLLNITTTKVRNVFDGPLFYQPTVTVGDGTTSLTAIMLFRIQLLRPIA